MTFLQLSLFSASTTLGQTFLSDNFVLICSKTLEGLMKTCLLHHNLKYFCFPLAMKGADCITNYNTVNGKEGCLFDQKIVSYITDTHECI